MVEGVLPVKSHQSNYMKKHPASCENTASSYNKENGKKKSYPPYQHGVNMGHPPFKCCRRPDTKYNK